MPIRDSDAFITPKKSYARVQSRESSTTKIEVAGQCSDTVGRSSVGTV